MLKREINARVKEKIDQKVAQLESRLASLAADQELQHELDAVVAEIAAIDEQLKHAEGLDPEAEARLEVRRERLLAKQERLELKLELLSEKRERLQEALNSLRDAYVAEPRWQSRAEVGQPSGGDTRRQQEERRKILEMVQDGKISAEDAAQLLEALIKQDEARQQRHRSPRWVRIRVTDTQTNRVRVNLTLPVGLVRAGLRAGGSIAGMEGLDTGGLEEMLNRGEIGHLVDINAEESGERVEIFVE